MSLKQVVFVKHHSIYNAGEVAGFDMETAQRLVKMGVARFKTGTEDNEAKKPEPKKEMVLVEFLRPTPAYAKGEKVAVTKEQALKMVKTKLVKILKDIEDEKVSTQKATKKEQKK